MFEKVMKNVDSMEKNALDLVYFSKTLHNSPNYKNWLIFLLPLYFFFIYSVPIFGDII